jgi:hypothetical protein
MATAPMIWQSRSFEKAESVTAGIDLPSLLPVGNYLFDKQVLTCLIRVKRNFRNKGNWSF